MNNLHIDKQVAVVVIGRNEGERLVRCFQSITKETINIIYVDSGSTDDSVKMAQARGIDVVCLDMIMPFTAARARNAGFKRLLVLYPEAQYVQFIDGDCQLVDGWLATGLAFISAHAEVAAVCGKRCEIYPEKSIYNQLCDLEWNTPIGESKACGGDVLMRVSAVASAHGYREDLIAGEEPELCVRLRRNGWRIWRLGADMTKHDAAMTDFTQWWRRAVRSGYAFAQGAHIHGAAPELHWVAESQRAMRWGFYLPLFILLACVFKPLFGLLFALIYPLQVLRLTFKSALPLKLAFLQAFYLTLGKFAEAIGQIKFIWHRYTHQQASIIEYK